MPRGRRSRRRSSIGRRSRRKSVKRNTRRRSSRRREVGTRRRYRANAEQTLFNSPELSDCDDIDNVELQELDDAWAAALLSQLPPYYIESPKSLSDGSYDRHVKELTLPSPDLITGDPFIMLCDGYLRHRSKQQTDEYKQLFDCGIAARQYVRLCTHPSPLSLFPTYVCHNTDDLLTYIKYRPDVELLCYCKYKSSGRLIHAFAIHTNIGGNLHTLRLVFSNQGEYDVAYSGLGETEGLGAIPKDLKENWEKIGLPYSEKEPWSVDSDGRQLFHYLTNVSACTYKKNDKYKMEGQLIARVFTLEDTQSAKRQKK